MLEVSRAAAAGDAIAVADALAASIARALHFGTVAVNLLDPGGTDTAVVAVVGDADARDALLGTVNPWSEWQAVLAGGHDRRGAIWLAAGTLEADPALSMWTPPMTRALLQADAWHPDDMLLLPLRDSSGEVIGVVSVDEPHTGLRPDDAQLEVLMTVVTHGALAIEHARRAVGRGPEPVHALHRA
jgi:hypothetical protein